ncbi:uncharacterized protein V1516DRAFT_299746 [Lipomyces oligophaga]|uniref:uncharacterized protein n=1 Tax=Lipomyces oligophaga TaxID=45792 RepID=UPI0034CE0028
MNSYDISSGNRSRHAFTSSASISSVSTGHGLNRLSMTPGTPKNTIAQMPFPANTQSQAMQVPLSNIAAMVAQSSGTAATMTVQSMPDKHEAIWAALDIMDKVKEDASKVMKSKRKETIPEGTQQDRELVLREHDSALQELKRAQIELVSELEKSDIAIELVSDENKLWDLDDQEISFDRTSELFKVDHFSHAQQMIELVMTKLDRVVRSMKALEAITRAEWGDEDKDELEDTTGL